MGFLIYIAFYILIINDLVRLIITRKYNKYKFSLYSILVLNLLNFMPIFPSGNFFNNWLSITYSIPLGFYLYLRLKYKENA